MISICESGIKVTMSENPLQSTRKCSYCLTEKPWIWQGKRLRDGSRIFVDTTGKRWAGKRCPTCEGKRVRATIYCPNFEKENIIRALEEEGYDIISKTPPLQVRRGDEVRDVAIRHATLEGGAMRIDTGEEEEIKNNPLCVLVFQSIRVLPPGQLEKLGLKENLTSANMGPPCSPS